jgi:hypothetical protein
MQRVGVLLAVAVVTALPSMGTVASLEHQQNDGSALTIEIDLPTAHFNVSIRGALWLRGGPPVAGWVGAGSLRLVAPPATSRGRDDVLGAYEETRFSWVAGGDGTKVQTAFRVFDDGVCHNHAHACMQVQHAHARTRHSPPSVACGAHARASSTCVQHPLLSMFCDVRDELAPADCQN